MKRIATHKNPDPDALVSTWLAERYLFPGEDVEIIFMGRKRPVHMITEIHCVVDAWNTYDPERLLFDHKPPAFEDRNQTCATRLIWEYLISLDRPVHHLSRLVQAIHEGDRNPPGKGGSALTWSKKEGFHAHYKQFRTRFKSDMALYQGMRMWLNDYDFTSRSGAETGKEATAYL